MSGEDKANNKVEELGGKAKEALGDATDDKRPPGSRPEGPDEEQPQAGRREGQGRLQVSPHPRTAEAAPTQGAASAASPRTFRGPKVRGSAGLSVPKVRRRSAHAPERVADPAGRRRPCPAGPAAHSRMTRQPAATSARVAGRSSFADLQPVEVVRPLVLDDQPAARARRGPPAPRNSPSSRTTNCGTGCGSPARTHATRTQDSGGVSLRRVDEREDRRARVSARHRPRRIEHRCRPPTSSRPVRTIASRSATAVRDRLQRRDVPRRPCSAVVRRRPSSVVDQLVGRSGVAVAPAHRADRARPSPAARARRPGRLRTRRERRTTRRPTGRRARPSAGMTRAAARANSRWSRASRPGSA